MGEFLNGFVELHICMMHRSISCVLKKDHSANHIFDTILSNSGE